ncbi:MAG: hypothetical protein GXX86_00495 [Propionibacterium sp.]|nr:hypothetical protein [Propionibacterium sp.]
MTRLPATAPIEDIQGALTEQGAVIVENLLDAGTLVAPGSHLWDPDRRAQPEDLVAAEMSPGSSVIYLGSTIHAGGANTTTDRRRRGLHLSYCVGWLRTEENHFLAAPPDRVRNFPREVQAMLGYDVHSDVHRRGGFLGSLDWQNPLDLLADGRL